MIAGFREVFKKNIETEVKDREANLVEIKQQHLKSLNDIKDIRRQINSRLDKLEKAMIDNLNSTETQVKLKIETLFYKLSEKMKLIELLRTNLMIVKQHASDLQAFIGSKMLEKDVTKELINELWTEYFLSLQSYRWLPQMLYCVESVMLSMFHALLIISALNVLKKLPAEICNIEQNCTEHDKKFQMFCPCHDQLCCIICISEKHKECTGIDETIKASRSSTLFGNLEKSLKDIQENIERVVKDRKANIVEIKQQHLKSLDDIKETRQKLNSRLDELEKNLIDNK
ncbi:unnamed protein product [Mytilus coruscus]|uniref:B box-type domain-containing protein n=1 Tax=Mytilus coruscus TaxID=42192 RepID=A0A6J8BDT6_MYTCO|nr:unnamed protein product [Mytilus coruscus]